MPRDARAQEVEADDVISQVCTKFSSDRFRNLQRRELNGTLSKWVLEERRRRDATSLLAIEKCLDLPVPFHAVGETGPAGAFSGAEHWPDQGKNAGWLDEHPLLLFRQMLPVQFS